MIPLKYHPKCHLSSMKKIKAPVLATSLTEVILHSHEACRKNCFAGPTVQIKCFCYSKAKNGMQWKRKQHWVRKVCQLKKSVGASTKPSRPTFTIKGFEILWPKALLVWLHQNGVWKESFQQLLISFSVKPPIHTSKSTNSKETQIRTLEKLAKSLNIVIGKKNLRNYLINSWTLFLHQLDATFWEQSVIPMKKGGFDRQFIRIWSLGLIVGRKI